LFYFDSETISAALAAFVLKKVFNEVMFLRIGFLVMLACKKVSKKIYVRGG